LSYEAETLRATLQKRILKHSRTPGMIPSSAARAPGGRTPQPTNDITGWGLIGFAYTGGDTGGFNTNPEGTP
jgi:hypothetical protein